MKQFRAEFYITAIFLSTVLFSCVPARQVEEMKSNYSKCQDERDALSAEKKNLETENTELKANSESKKKRIEALRSDTTVLGAALRTMRMQYDKINKLNDELLKKQSELRKGSEEENKKLMAELQALQEELQKKEDALKAMEKELNARKTNLDKLSAELKDREKRVKELQELIDKKDAKMKALKDEVSNALKGFEGKGLTVEERNGKIYVSMEAKLLFSKGSTVIDQKGKKALIDLAKVLEEQQDIHILVEGHTDTDKMNTKSIPRDNWELSVLRATAVVKIMTKNSSVDPTRLTAAGRSEYVPVDPGLDEKAKTKNRRIEVILTPNLDDLYKILEN